MRSGDAGRLGHVAERALAGVEVELVADAEADLRLTAVDRGRQPIL